MIPQLGLCAIITRPLKSCAELEDGIGIGGHGFRYMKHMGGLARVLGWRLISAWYKVGPGASCCCFYFCRPCFQVNQAVHAAFTAGRALFKSARGCSAGADRSIGPLMRGFCSTPICTCLGVASVVSSVYCAVAQCYHAEQNTAMQSNCLLPWKRLAPSARRAPASAWCQRRPSALLLFLSLRQRSHQMQHAVAAC